jgi:hypothetical protein
MRAHYRRDLGEDRGSIILALLGILILTTVASVGLASVVNGQHQSRHDDTFTQALNNAESGVDAMVATIKQGGLNNIYSGPSTASAFDAAHPVTLTGSVTQANDEPGTYSVNATAKNDLGIDGAAAYTTWTITSTGTAVTQKNTITRSVSETVRITHSYNTPVEGAQGLSLNSGSSVTDYQYNNNPNSDSIPIAGVGLTFGSLHLTLANLTVQGIPVNGSPGAAQGGGPAGVTLGSGLDPSGFSAVAVDQGGTCTGTACSTSTVVNQPNIPAPAITPAGTCASYSNTGASVNAPPLPPVDLAVVPLSGLLNGLVLNDNVGVNLNPANPTITNTVCTTLPIIIPTVGVSTGTLPLGLGTLNIASLSATLQVPIGANCGTNNLLTQLLSTTCTMNPPQDLDLNELGGAEVVVGTSGCPAAPAACTPTLISGVISSPGGDCYINGNVTLLGSIECKTITMAPNATLNVYYPTDQPALTATHTQNQDAVTNWNEKH